MKNYDALIKTCITSKEYVKALEYLSEFVPHIGTLEESSQMDYAKYMDAIVVVFKAEAFEEALKMYTLMEDNISDAKYAAQCHNYMGICQVHLNKNKKEVFQSFTRACKLDTCDMYEENLKLCLKKDLDPKDLRYGEMSHKLIDTTIDDALVDSTVKLIKNEARRIEVNGKEIAFVEFNSSMYGQVNHVDLSALHLTSLPAWLKNFENIISLDISHNEIAKHPEFFNLSQSLRYLNISHNKMKRMVTDFFRFPNLQYLDISNNGLSDIALSFYTHELIYLDVSSNTLTKFKNGFIDDIPNLQYFDFSHNNIKVLPDALQKRGFQSTERYTQTHQDTYKQFVKDQSMPLKGFSFEHREPFEMISYWEEKSPFYNLEWCHDFVLSSDDSEFLDYWLTEKPTDAVKKSFSVFAQTGEGGNYAYWNYEGLVGDAPIVFFGSDGAYNMIAACEEDLVCLLATGRYMDAEADDGEVWSETTWYSRIEDLVEDGEFDAYEDAERAFYADISSFAEIVKMKYELQKPEVYMENMKRHPSFRDWIENITNDEE